MGYGIGSSRSREVPSGDLRNENHKYQPPYLNSQQRNVMWQRGGLAQPVRRLYGTYAMTRFRFPEEILFFPSPYQIGSRVHLTPYPDVKVVVSSG
jgi:hypothetical protein